MNFGENFLLNVDDGDEGKRILKPKPIRGLSGGHFLRSSACPVVSAGGCYRFPAPPAGPWLHDSGKLEEERCVI